MTLSRTHIRAAALVLALAARPAFAQPAPLPPAPPDVTLVAPAIADVALPAEIPQTPRPSQTPPPTVAPMPVPPEPAQRPPARPATPAPPAVALRPPEPPGQLLNVKIELTILEEGGSTPAAKKTVSMTVADREFGQIRSSANVPGPMINLPGSMRAEVPLNVDARPWIQTDGKTIRMNMTINYDSPGAPPMEPNARTTVPSHMEIREQLGFILQDGRPLVVSQSADPVGDRKVTVEVKATILR